jgi:hypothetical protein
MPFHFVRVVPARPFHRLGRCIGQHVAEDAPSLGHRVHGTSEGCDEG